MKKVVALIGILIVFRVFISFLGYLEFKSHKVLKINAKVVNQYKKKNYWVLKLKTTSLSFYTTSKDNLKNLLNDNVKLDIITLKVSFFDYLFTFYAPSFNLKLLPLSKIQIFIAFQHKDEKLSNLFRALFLGESMDYKTKEELSTLGISHLLALSGLHLGFISMFLYFVLLPVYKIFHSKFPYRNRFFDLGVVVLAVEFLYLYFTSFPPSLVRAFVLEVVVFLYMMYLKKPFSLEVLLMVIVISFIVFGFKVFSLGYFLSILGVFYIYLFFNHFRFGFLSSVLLSFYMFLVMFVISHTFFCNFNMYQLFSPFVNIAFSLFYPLEVLLHFIGFGGVFDNVIKSYLLLGDKFVCVKFPLIFGVLFILVSFWAFFSKRVFFGINLISLISIFYAIGESIG